MRILTLSKWLLPTIIFATLSNSLKAQNTKSTSNNESKFEKLLNEKRKIHASIALNERYKIQIFSGENEKAKKTILQFKQEFNDIEATIVFNTPNYRVWVGNFKTRMEAERYFAEIKKKYKNLLLIKPTK